MDGLRVIGHQRHSSDSAGPRVTHAAQQACFLLTSAAKLVLLQQHKNEPHELVPRHASVVYAGEKKPVSNLPGKGAWMTPAGTR